MAALTLVTAKGAIGAALTQLAAAAGVGAGLGKHMQRLGVVIHEKLLGSPEFDAFKVATASFRALFESSARQCVDAPLSEASALVMDRDEPLLQALEHLRKPPAEGDSGAKTQDARVVQS